MKKLLLLALISLFTCKDIILIGDSRYVGMATMLMGFSYSTIKNNGGTGTNVRSTSPKTYGGNSIQVTAQVSASSYTFSQGSDILNSVHNQLRNAKSGTSVLFWLGINDCDAVTSTYNFYSSLAKSYPKLKFYAISITGVNESKIWIKNSSARSFNSQLAAKIQKGKISNLTYKSILSGDDVNTIIVGGSKVAIANYLTSDGIHYTREGYNQLWKAMVSKI